MADGQPTEADIKLMKAIFGEDWQNGDAPKKESKQVESKNLKEDLTRLKSNLQPLQLTKREHFATLAMQGLLAHYLSEHVTGWDIKTYAAESVALADALIAELNTAQG